MRLARSPRVKKTEKMSPEQQAAEERTPLLHSSRVAQLQHEQDEEAQSTISSTVTKDEQQLAGSTVGERLPYNDYTTIDWLHDLVPTYVARTNCPVLIYGKGQRLLPLSLYSIASRTAIQSSVSVRRLLWMDCRSRHRSVDRLCCFRG